MCNLSRQNLSYILQYPCSTDHKQDWQPYTRLMSIVCWNSYGSLTPTWNQVTGCILLYPFIFETHVIMPSRCRENQTPRFFSLINSWTLLNPRAYSARRRNNRNVDQNPTPASPSTRRAIYWGDYDEAWSKMSLSYRRSHWSDKTVLLGK